MEKSLEVAQAISLHHVISQHESIWSDAGMLLECLYTGNVSEMDARTFFERATDIVKSRAKSTQVGEATPNWGWVPG